MSFKLAFQVTFWALLDIQNVKAQDYSSSLKQLSSFNDSQQFWQFFQYLKPTKEIPNCDMYLFRFGVKPQWQDQNNVGGGCFKMKIEKKKSNKLWQNAIFTMVSPKNTCADLMNGVRIKIREHFDEIEIWMNSGATDLQKLDSLKVILKENLQLSDQRCFNYLSFAKK